MSRHPELSDRAGHEEVDGFDIGGQHGQKSVPLGSGGFKVGGPEARLKRGPSDDVIILSQP